MAIQAQFVLGGRQRLAGGHAQLPFDQVMAGDHFGDRVLHLQPGIHFHEVEAAVGFGDELDGARAYVAHRARRRYRRLAHGAAAFRRHARRGRFLDDFLVAPLHGTVAFEQVDAIAVAVGEHLDFDVARLLQVALDEYAVIAEAGAGFTLARGQRVGEGGALLDHAHAFAAAAGAGLDQYRVADGVGLLPEELRILVFAMVAGHQRHAGALHQRLGGRFAAHGGDRAGRRADEHHAGLRHGFGKAFVFGQEAVAGVDGLRAGVARGLQDGIGAQVAGARLGAADMHGDIAGGHMARVGVGIGIDGDGAKAHAAGGGGDAAGDFAAVGNQQGGEHDGSLVARRRGVAPWRITCGKRRSACLRSAHSGPPTAPGPARGGYRPAR